MHLGATALDIQYGAGHNTVAGNLIQDVSGNGISIARSSCPKPEMFANQIPATGMETERHNLISNNYITRIGTDFLGRLAYWPVMQTMLPLNITKFGIVLIPA